MRGCLSVLFLLASACGNASSTTADAAPPGLADAAPAPGGPALLVTGAISVDNRGNGTAGANARVSASLRVSRDGEPVGNALIRLNPPGAIQTYLTGEALDPSLYTGSYMGYNNDTVRIEITVGEQRIDETLLLGQSMFAIVEPGRDARVSAGADLPVRWERRGAGADVLRVTTSAGHDSGELPDAAEHTLPGAEVASGRWELSVWRGRRNPLPQAAPGSSIDFGVDSRVSVTVE